MKQNHNKGNENASDFLVILRYMTNDQLEVLKKSNREECTFVKSRSRIYLVVIIG